MLKLPDTTSIDVHPENKISFSFWVLFMSIIWVRRIGHVRSFHLCLDGLLAGWQKEMQKRNESGQEDPRLLSLSVSLSLSLSNGWMVDWMEKMAGRVAFRSENFGRSLWRKQWLWQTAEPSEFSKFQTFYVHLADMFWNQKRTSDGDCVGNQK